MGHVLIRHPLLSVIICTHRPKPEALRRTLRGLCAQSLDPESWDCVIVDNASGDDFPYAMVEVEAPHRSRVVQEPQLGLTHARRRGYLESKGEILVFVDDDNVLDPDYLRHAADFLHRHQNVGCLGGNSFPEFEKKPEPWALEFLHLLALRDMGPNALFSHNENEPPPRLYPSCAPIGAGMVTRRSALHSWFHASANDRLTDRCGNSLSSAGDNDMVLHMLEAGWRAAYVPALSLVHLIPASRLTPAYLARLNRGIQKSWMQVLTLHKVNPWSTIPRWTIPLRKGKAWLTYHAWTDASAYIRWQGACGHFEGRSR